MVVVLALLGLCLICAHYVGQKYYDVFSHHSRKIKYNRFKSITAGSAMAYLFVSLLPKLSQGYVSLGSVLFVPALLAFTSVHIVEKHIYKSYKGKLIRKELAVEDTVVSFIYHFFGGIILANLLSQDTGAGLVFFFVLVVNTLASTFPAEKSSSSLLNSILALSMPVGLFLGSLYPLPLQLYFGFLSVLFGSLLFVVTRHSLPVKKEGDPVYFALGVAIYGSLVIMVEVFFGIV